MTDDSTDKPVQTFSIDTDVDYGFVVVSPPDVDVAPEGVTLIDAHTAFSPKLDADPKLRRNVALTLVSVANGLEPGLHAHSHTDISGDLKEAKAMVQKTALTPLNIIVGTFGGVLFTVFGLVGALVALGPPGLLFAATALIGSIFVHWSLGMYTAFYIAARVFNNRRRAKDADPD